MPQQQQQPQQGPRAAAAPDPLATRLVLSGAAAAVAETVTFPLDAVKTRMQLQVC